MKGFLVSVCTFLLLLNQVSAATVFWPQVVDWPTQNQAKIACVAGVDLDALSQSVVSISVVQPDGTIASGTAWAIAPNTLLTVRHVFEDVTTDEPFDILINADWGGEVTIARSPLVGQLPTGALTIPVRLLEIMDFPDNQEGFVVFEIPGLVTEQLGIVSVRTGHQRLNDGDAVLSIAYPAEVAGGDTFLRFAVGNYRPPQVKENESSSNQVTLPPAEMYEFTAVPADLSKMAEENSTRTILGHGASGAPVFNCDGLVVGVITSLFVQAEWVFGGPSALVIPRRWGEPTNFGLRAP